jgi:hypothetical protein
MSKIEIDLPYPVNIQITEPANQLITWREALHRVANDLPVEAQAGTAHWKDFRNLAFNTISNLSNWIGYSFRIPPTTVKLSIS